MIRLVKDGDVSAIYEIYKPYILNTNITFETEDMGLTSFKERVRRISKEYPYLVYVDNDKIAGYAYASEFRERKAFKVSAEISVYVSDEYKHKGIGKSLLSELLNELKKQNVDTAISCVTYPNKASDGLHKLLGFEVCGHIKSCGLKNDQLLDVVFYEKIIGDSHKPFIPYDEVINRHE